MRSLLLSYPGNEALGEGLRRALGAEAVRFLMRHFPDGETYARVDSDVEDQAVAILCSLRDPDTHFLPLVFLADTLRDLGARQVGLIAPYLAYMRQDRRFQPGEALTSTSFARLLSARFDLARRRLGYVTLPPLRTDLFRVPQDPDPQLSLF